MERDEVLSCPLSPWTSSAPSQTLPDFTVTWGGTVLPVKTRAHTHTPQTSYDVVRTSSARPDCLKMLDWVLRGRTHFISETNRLPVETGERKEKLLAAVDSSSMFVSDAEPRREGPGHFTTSHQPLRRKRGYRALITDRQEAEVRSVCTSQGLRLD